MNIFVLDENPRLCAQYHCDKHVIKMCTETAQILCTAIHKRINQTKEDLKDYVEHLKVCGPCRLMADLRGFDYDEEIGKLDKLQESIPYKAWNPNHPAVVWASYSNLNFSWLLSLGFNLCAEYTLRYEKRHKSENVVDWVNKEFENLMIYFDGSKLSENYKHQNIPDRKPDFVQIMPDELMSDDTVQSYRNLYMTDKRHLAIWNKGSGIPDWFK